MSGNRTIAAIATPPGQGGIAVVRLSGAQAYSIASNVFETNNPQKKLDKMPGYTALYGQLFSRGRLIDDGIALGFRAPASYTGEDVVELSFHGSDVIAQAVLAACIENGAAPAGPGEFTRRALENGKMGLTQAEAVADLVDASSRQGAAAAQALLKGALQQKIAELKTRLITLAGHLAAFVDYPEEDVEELTKAEFLQTAADVQAELEKMIGEYDRGAMVMRGIRAAIVGSPNVGKSTLFNLLSGFERAIVTPTAGTTRDVVHEQIQVGGLQLKLADTAGLRETEDPIEGEGIRRSYAEIEESQLVIAVFDGSRPADADDLALAEKCKDRNALAVINKSDLGTQMRAEELQPYFKELLVVSATDAATAGKVENAIVALLGLGAWDPDAGMLANQRQLNAAVSASTALKDAISAINMGLELDAASVCLDDALLALAELSGENVTDSVLDEVFSKFCVGK